MTQTEDTAVYIHMSIQYFGAIGIRGTVAVSLPHSSFLINGGGISRENLSLCRNFALILIISVRAVLSENHSPLRASGIWSIVGPECEFKHQCRQKALEIDELSLLSGASPRLNAIAIEARRYSPLGSFRTRSDRAARAKGKESCNAALLRVAGAHHPREHCLYPSRRALAAYKDFLTLWKDADPDIPILKEAKSEYAKPQ